MPQQPALVFMSVFHLPYDVFPGTSFVHDDIIIHDYTATMNSFKGKSILHKNAISLVTEGEKTMYFAENTVHVNDGEFHFLSAGNCLASMDLSRQDVFKSILIFFDDKVLADFYLKNDALIRQLRKTIRPKPEAYISLKKDAFINNYIASLRLIFDNGHVISRQMKQLKFEELMQYLLERYPQQLLSFQRNSNNKFDDLDIRKTVAANVLNNLTIEELAFLCNLSISTFKRRFLQLYGMPPGKWLLQQKMALAAQMLHRNENPAEIFHKLGYENHSSFTKSFRQVYGTTPTAYRAHKPDL